MPDTNENLLKRLEHLEKSFKINFSHLDKQFHEISRNYFFNLYHYFAREIKNEADLDLLKEYLIHTGQIDIFDFINFKKESDLMKTYIHENQNALKVFDFFNSTEHAPSKQIQLFNYVNNSNLLIQKKRFQIKKHLLLDRGYDENSEEVTDTDELIQIYDDKIKEKYEKTPSFEEKQYYIKKSDAEEIYDGCFIDNNEEIIERIREIPLLKDIHFEPSCKALYSETICNYWMGNFNAAIILLSVFLEAYLKELYYFKENENSDETLGPLIITCSKQNIINSDQKDFLSDFVETVRNNYIHAKNHKIVTDVTLPMAKIDLKSSSKPESTYGTSEQFPFLRDIAKKGKDKVDSKHLIIEIAKIVMDISKSYDELSEEDEELD